MAEIVSHYLEKNINLFLYSHPHKSCEIKPIFSCMETIHKRLRLFYLYLEYRVYTAHLGLVFNAIAGFFAIKENS